MREWPERRVRPRLRQESPPVVCEGCAVFFNGNKPFSDFLRVLFSIGLLRTMEGESRFIQEGAVGRRRGIHHGESFFDQCAHPMDIPECRRQIVGFRAFLQCRRNVLALLSCEFPMVPWLWLQRNSVDSVSFIGMDEIGDATVRFSHNLRHFSDAFALIR